MADGQLTTGGAEQTDQVIGLASGEPNKLVTTGNAEMIAEIAKAGKGKLAQEPVPVTVAGLEAETHQVVPGSVTETSTLASPAGSGVALLAGEQPLTALVAVPAQVAEPPKATVEQIITAYHANNIAALQDFPETNFDSPSKV